MIIGSIVHLVSGYGHRIRRGPLDMEHACGCSRINLDRHAHACSGMIYDEDPLHMQILQLH